MVLVAIEGPDGSGKSTQVRLVTSVLRQRGFAVRTSAPTFLISSMKPDTALNRALFPISPRRTRVENAFGRGRPHKISRFLRHVLISVLGLVYAWIVHLVLRLKNRNDVIVICDRFLFQFIFDLFPEDAFPIIASLPGPNLGFILLLDEEMLQRRPKSRADSSIPSWYIRRVLLLYERIADMPGMIRVSAVQEKHITAEFISSEIERYVGGMSFG